MNVDIIMQKFISNTPQLCFNWAHKIKTERKTTGNKSIELKHTRNSSIADKPRDAFRGQSRSPNTVPSHMLGIVSN